MVNKKSNLKELRKVILKKYDLESLASTLTSLSKEEEKYVSGENLDIHYSVLQDLDLVSFSKGEASRVSLDRGGRGWETVYFPVYYYSFTDLGKRVLFSFGGKYGK